MNLSPSLAVGGASSLAVFWEDGERVLCRGSRDDGNGDRTAVLAVLATAEHPTPDLVERLAHEYALRDELDGRSAVRPLALCANRGQPCCCWRIPGASRSIGCWADPWRSAGSCTSQLDYRWRFANPLFAIQFFTALAEEGLLAFDPVARAWQWNMDRIRAKSYTDNVVDLMAGKLKRFSSTSQEALKRFACLGNVAEIATLALVHGTTEEAMHAALWEPFEL